jgi:excisionase family DNA binding protein
MPEELTTKQVAQLLGVSTRRVLQLIHAGRLPAEKHGRDWAIRASDLELVKVRKPGRPQKGAKVQVDAQLDPSKTTVYFIRRPSDAP